MRNVSHKHSRDNKNAYFILFHAVYEIMQKNTVEPGGPRTATWCMPIAGQIPKATNTLRIHKSTPFQCKNRCMNAPQCCVIHKMLVLLLITW